MTNEVVNVPELRFTGFEDEWKKKKLDDVANYRRGSFPQPYGNKEWYDEKNGEPFVQVVDVDKNMKLHDQTKQKISDLAKPKSVKGFKGDIVVTLQGSIGRVALLHYDAYIDRTLLLIDSFKIEMNKNYFKYVLYLLFLKEKERAPGGTIKTITKKVLSNFKIDIPNVGEQEKIGEFFSKLDRQIELEEQKLAKLEEQKKGYMQQIFSQQLRFKDENGDYYSEWKEKLIKDILEFENNRRKPITSSLREIGKYPYYGATGIIDYVKDYIFDGETRLLIGEDGAKWGAFEESSFIAKNRYWVNNHAHVCKSKINNLDFLNYLLNYKELRTYVTGNAPAKLTYNNLSMIPMFLPSVYEQEKIGNFLKKIDELIGKQNKKINELKIRKQGFLQKMFI
ncbi:restriction endonuclease subunit S [Staphylococcus gallinarum]|uniref:Restriction endonuclease subunit S n=1 Tax=Staphylococcus gallinarum TaxID=1293 RepID=A0A3A0VKX0_STAGA|nr:restriction endonuclease subunit S [Staphylococcus gallinarum]RIP32036.1 restriction endonuclease subunit S [Staphylococcus gallinarum]